MRKFYDIELIGGGSYEELPENIEINPSIGDLYQNVLNHYSSRGICRAIEIYAPFNKVELLGKHFKMQKPTIFSKFWWHNSYRGEAFWWNGVGANEQRKLFLAHLAKKYKNKYFK